MRRPLTLDDARARGLLTLDRLGIHTFSSGTQWEGWADSNCFECWFYQHEGDAGEFCAFEAASMLSVCSPELAEMFGWLQNPKFHRHNDRRRGWEAPERCALFHQRPEPGEDGEDIPLPPLPDPRQLVLLADPTEDLAVFPEALPERLERVAVSA